MDAAYQRPAVLVGEGYEAILFRKSLLGKSKPEREGRAVFIVGAHELELSILDIFSTTHGYAAICTIKPYVQSVRSSNSNLLFMVRQA